MKPAVKGQYYRTSEYGRFKPLLGNRDVTPQRVAKIRKSILDRGYVVNPIIVNEKYEVIDGQGRLQALREMNLPVDFIVVPGLTLADCVAMNVNLTNWTAGDFVRSYAARGDKSYITLQRYLEEYPGINVSVTASCLTGVFSNAGGVSGLREGRFHLPDDYDDDDARRRMEYVKRLSNYTTQRNVLLAALFCRSCVGADEDRLIDVISGNTEDVERPSRITDACRVIEELYNFRRVEKARVYFQQEYDRSRRRARTKGAKA